MTGNLILKGGPVMVPIILLSVVALAIILDRARVLWGIRLDVPRFAAEVFRDLKEGRVREAMERCRATRHPIAGIFRAAIANRSLPRGELEKLMEREGEERIYRLERYMGPLIVIVGVEPMLGFLGTITGLIRAFRSWETLGNSITVNALAAGIYEAMITTAAGLVIAIPYYLAYHYLAGRIKDCAHVMAYYGDQLAGILAGEAREP